MAADDLLIWLRDRRDVARAELDAMDENDYDLERGDTLRERIATYSEVIQHIQFGGGS